MSAMYYSNWKFNQYLIKCLLNGRCPLFRLSINRGSTVHTLLTVSCGMCSKHCIKLPFHQRVYPSAMCLLRCKSKGRQTFHWRGAFVAKIIFCFLSENECLNGMEPVYIFVFFSETQTPSYTACYILYFWRSYFTSVTGMVCHDVTRGLLHGDLQQNQ